MLSQKILEALNNHLNKEFYSYYLYLSMAAYCYQENLPGFGHWLTVQADEERQHAMKLFRYILERGGTVQLHAIASPPERWNGIRHLFEEILAHEEEVTQSVNQIFDLATHEKDYPTQVMLQWFIQEQVEEENQARDILSMLAKADDNPSALLFLDARMASRQP